MDRALAWMAPNRSLAVVMVDNQGGGRALKACDQAGPALISKGIESSEWSG